MLIFTVKNILIRSMFLCKWNGFCPDILLDIVPSDTDTLLLFTALKLLSDINAFAVAIFSTVCYICLASK